MADKSSNVEVSTDTQKLQGLVTSEGIATFLGVLFAQVPDRFRQAISIEDIGVAEHALGDATSFGPRCPQVEDSFGDAKEIFFQGLHPNSGSPDSDSDCLRLNIYAPVGALHSANKLPVVVWIHGGGFVTGDGNRGHDGNFLVRHSIKIQKPFIFVSLNYRLGYYGFLHSRELLEEPLAKGEKGYANQGLYDQRLGLQWIQHNIGFFGGDPSNVTLAGESAGAFSVLAHLFSASPLCRQSIAMSCPSWPMQSRDEAQRAFDRLVASTGLAPSSAAAEKLAAVRALTNEQLNEHLGAPIMSITFNDKWFSSTAKPPTLQLEDMVSRLENDMRLMFGWTKHEISLWSMPWLSWSVEQLQAMIRAVIPDDGFADEIIGQYQIVAPRDTAIQGVLQFGSDSLFSSIPQRLVDMSSVPCAVYRFDQVDEGEWSPLKGLSPHGLDNGYFMRYPYVAGAGASSCSRSTADHFSQAITDFAYGSMPWEDYRDSGRIMVINGSNSSLSEADIIGKWKGLATTVEKRNMFVKAGHLMIRYRPDAV